MQYDTTLELISATIYYLTSTTFKNSVRRLLKRTKEKSPGEARQAIDTFEKRTLDELTERQAEAITLEYMYLALLEGRISKENALNNLSALGYTINPNPLAWLQKRLTKLRQWIIDAVKWLRMVGEILMLSVKEINIEIGVTPRVSITFIPKADVVKKR